MRNFHFNTMFQIINMNYAILNCSPVWRQNNTNNWFPASRRLSVALLRFAVSYKLCCLAAYRHIYRTFRTTIRYRCIIYWFHLNRNYWTLNSVFYHNATQLWVSIWTMRHILFKLWVKYLFSNNWKIKINVPMLLNNNFCSSQLCWWLYISWCLH